MASSIARRLGERPNRPPNRLLNKLLFALLVLAAPCVWAAKPKEDVAQLALEAGTALSNKKDYEAAVQKFAEAARLKPGFVNAYLQAARTYTLWGKRKEGLERLELAAKFASRRDQRQKVHEERTNLTEVFFTTDTFQLYQNGLNFLLLERANAAVDSLERALKKEPDNVAILVAYAEALAKDNNVANSTKAYEQAFALNPDKREARQGLAEAVLEKQPKRAQNLLELLALDPAAAESLVLLYARALQANGKDRDALELVRNRAEHNSDWVDSLLWLGRNYSQSKDGAWLARKYLMLFLKREREKTRPAPLREEAQALLSRVNDSLR